MFLLESVDRIIDPWAPRAERPRPDRHVARASAQASRRHAARMVEIIDPWKRSRAGHRRSAPLFVDPWAH
jgi:hypothetical protein